MKYIEINEDLYTPGKDDKETIDKAIKDVIIPHSKDINNNNFKSLFPSAYNKTVTYILDNSGITYFPYINAIYSSMYAERTDILKVILPDNIEEIGEYSFYKCSNLTSITLPPKFEYGILNRYCFFECSSLSEIDIPDGIVSMKSEAFGGCRNLAHISLPSSLKRIERGVFHKCDNLQVIYYEGNMDDWRKIIIYGYNGKDWLKNCTVDEDWLKNCTVTCEDGDIKY